MDIKVKNMSTTNSNTAPNQFIIQGKDFEIFQSYNAIIVKQMLDGSGKTYLDENYWDYSSTTGKYRNMFLGEDKKATLTKIASGEYLLVDLNKEVAW